MSLVTRIAALAARIGLELKTKIGAGHPGLARAWVCFGYIDGKIQMRSTFNVASVARLSAGRYRVNFAVPMPDANYCWFALARSSTNSSTQRVAIIRSTSDLKTSAYVDVACATTSASFADSTEINLVVYR